MRLESEVVVATPPTLGERVVIMLPRLNEDFPGPLKEAIVRRRRAVTEGRCPCGAVGVLNGNGPLRIIVFDHEDDCSAHDEAIRDLLDRYGVNA